MYTRACTLVPGCFGHPQTIATRFSAEDLVQLAKEAEGLTEEKTRYRHAANV